VNADLKGLGLGDAAIMAINIKHQHCAT